MYVPHKQNGVPLKFSFVSFVHVDGMPLGSPPKPGPVSSRKCPKMDSTGGRAREYVHYLDLSTRDSYGREKSGVFSFSREPLVIDHRDDGQTTIFTSSPKTKNATHHTPPLHSRAK